jgi:hypothetical protein
MRFRGGEEALNHVEPGSRGRREVQMEARMGLEPALYGRRLVGGIVVDDQVEIETGRGSMIDQLEKAQELSMPVARHAGPDHLAVQHVERREQGRASGGQSAGSCQPPQQSPPPSAHRSPTARSVLSRPLSAGCFGPGTAAPIVRSAVLIAICSIFLIGAFSQVRADF